MKYYNEGKYQFVSIRKTIKDVSLAICAFILILAFMALFTALMSIVCS